ncbi:TIM44-like domain-containing protein [Phenylobacterium deserti]|uniref:Tim44-like domain-containing protein n=1 Tax=Phenylobacterium deserti TaxID=1914756 RepID=A0A328ABB6_9CAUL|nr:TIM44-like domain-containing protein [Phenylobacterium deserti]RAK52083.1 hypothetical protein DJ018_13085 [Phenylobacterium deserti]
MNQPFKKAALLTAAMAVFSFGALDAADARPRGGFGSRGARTWQAPPATRTAPTQAAPIERSMAARPPGAQQPGAQQPGARAQTAGQPGAVQPQRRGGMMGGILGGLLVGGLLGAMLGNGFGAGAGALFATLIQIGVVVLGVMLLMRLFRRRQQQQPAMAGQGASPFANRFEAPDSHSGARPASTGGFGGFGGASTAVPPSPVEIAVTNTDRDAFERLLNEVQTAYGRADFGALRERTTPEVMGYLAEQLSENATKGRRNELSGIRLVQADVAEAWREGEVEYASAALQYEIIDVTRDIQTGTVVEGDAYNPQLVTEIWTFTRRPGEDWKLSALQDA